MIKKEHIVMIGFITCLVIVLLQLPRPARQTSPKNSSVLGTTNNTNHNVLQLNWLLPPFIHIEPPGTPTPTSTSPFLSPTPTSPVASPTPTTPSSGGSPTPSPTPFSYFSTPTPTTNPCPNCCLDSGNVLQGNPPTCQCEPAEDMYQCSHGQCVLGSGWHCDPVNNNNSQSQTNSWCRRSNGGPSTDAPDGWYCNAKPVIYLYPTEKTVVDVTMTMQQGFVTASDPLYDEIFHGWHDVTAYPDGKLEYRGKTYRELFYETAIRNVLPLPGGIIIAKDQLKPELTRITAALGLLPNEQAEFLSYWVPQLTDLNSSFVLFSLLSKREKQRIDNVVISPKPDTFIAISAYFKPLNHPIAVEPLQLPLTPPARIGFTAVEWGGTIDRNN